MHWSEPPTPVIIKSKNGANSTDGPKSGSIFSRLQSLLVEEDVDDNDEDSSDEDADDDDDDVVSIVGMNESNEKDSGLVDFSELSLDQRTYIQLRSIHLRPVSPTFNGSICGGKRRIGGAQVCT